MGAVANPDAIVVDTAYGLQSLPAGFPSWITPELLQQAASDAAAIAVDTPPPAVIVQGDEGPTYIIPGAPDWVNQTLLQQAGQIPTPPPPPQEPPQPQGPNIPPPIGGGASSTPPLPAGPIVAGQTGNPPQVGPNPRQPGGLPAAVKDTRDAAGRVLGGVKDAVGAAAGAVGDVAARIFDGVKAMADALLPTIQELALGLTSRFADLAGFIGEKVVDVGTFAGAMATHAAAAMSVVLEDAWAWILRALGKLLGLLSSPLAAARASLLADMLEPLSW